MSSDQHMKKLMSLRDSPNVMMQFCMQQHFADRCQLHEHPGGHASWREPTMRKFSKESTTYFVRGLVCRWNIQKMQSESTEYARKITEFFTNSWRIKIALPKLSNTVSMILWKRAVPSSPKGYLEIRSLAVAATGAVDDGKLGSGPRHEVIRQRPAMPCYLDVSGVVAFS